MWKKVVLVIIIFVGGMFILQFAGLEWTKFFKPKWQNVEREVFENTKSYTHGVIQDLAKYYEEYHQTHSTHDKTTIKNIIQIRFAEFDESKIKSPKLKSFLIEMRGY